MIKLDNIEKIYKGKEVDTYALRKLSIHVKEGELVSIVGQSGSGKSTLLNILGCMDRFDSGEYEFEGESLSKYSSVQLAEFRNKKIGFIFQSFNLINEMSVLDNIEVPMGYAGIASKERRERAMEILDKVGLKDKAKSFPNELSGGQQQRIAIARALVNKPRVVLADEPTGNLDSNTSEEILNLIKEIHANGTTVILVTHDNDIADRCNKKIIVKDGEVHKIVNLTV